VRNGSTAGSSDGHFLITVNAAVPIRPLRHLKSGLNLKRTAWGFEGRKNYAVLFNTPSKLRWLLERIDKDIGLNGTIVRLHEDWYDLLTEDPSVISEVRRLNGEPLIVFNHIPAEFGDGSGEQDRKPPRNFKEWGEYVSRVVLRYKSLGVHRYEVWNEPDLRQYWLGTLDEFLALYETTARAIIRADNEALIFGPAAFSAGGEMESGRGPFLFNLIDFVASKKLPLHVLSFHDYDGSPDFPDRGTIDRLRARLKAKGYEATGIAVDEWNEFTCCNWNDPRNGNEVSAARHLAQIGQYILANVDYQAYWSGIGSPLHLNAHSQEYFGSFDFFTDDGVIKAKYNAARIVSMMGNTVVSSQLNGEVSNKVIAAKSDHKITLAIANPSDGAFRDVLIRVTDVKSTYDEHTTYRIDANHSNAYSVKDQISSTVTRGRNTALDAALTAFPKALSLTGFPQDTVDEAVKLFRLYLMNSGDPEAARWFSARSPAEQKQVYVAVNAAGDAYQATLMPVIDRINNWDGVKLYSETRSVLPVNGVFSEAIEVQPHSVILIVLEDSPHHRAGDEHGTRE
jgi:hypothetical protein